jgi:hypothetical protein
MTTIREALRANHCHIATIREAVPLPESRHTMAVTEVGYYYITPTSVPVTLLSI